MEKNSNYDLIYSVKFQRPNLKLLGLRCKIRSGVSNCFTGNLCFLLEYNVNLPDLQR